MNTQPKVAIIMSIYKSDDCNAFVQSIESLINQSYSSDIYLYRDGDIPQNLQSSVDQYSKRSDVFYFESSINNGLANALNILIEHVVTKDYQYVARMDSDDISYQNRIEKQVYFLEKNKDIDVCGTACKEFGASFSLEEKKLPTEHYKLVDFSIIRCPFIHPTVMFRVGVFKDGIRYPTVTVLTEDMALWFLLLEHGYYFSNLNDVLLDYRLNENTIERRTGFGKAISEIQLRFKYMKLLKRVSIRNIVMISARLVFHMMPGFMLKLLYRFFR